MIEELRKKAEEIGKELEDIRKTICETDNARKINESSYSKEKSLNRKYLEIMEEIQHLDSYSANKELQEIIKKITDYAEEDYNNFKFFENAEAKFTSFGKKGRELHVDIICSQICDHDIKQVLESAEKVTGRKIKDWFVSASIGYNPSKDAKAWLTYYLTFEGENQYVKQEGGLAEERIAHDGIHPTNKFVGILPTIL
jgi:hypothetical protein